MDLRRITAYFAAAECVIRAGDDLSRMQDLTEYISIGSKSPEISHAADCCVRLTFTGAAAGAIFGMFASVLSAAGLLSAMLPATGLVCGAVAGAILGSCIDFISYDSLSSLPYISCIALPENCGSIIKLLREKGALKIEMAEPT